MHTFEEVDNLECLQARKTHLFNTNRDDAVQYEYVSVCIKTYNTWIRPRPWHRFTLQSTYHLLHFPLRPAVALIPVVGIKLKKIKI